MGKINEVGFQVGRSYIVQVAFKEFLYTESYNYSFYYFTILARVDERCFRVGNRISGLDPFSIAFSQIFLLLSEPSKFKGQSQLSRTESPLTISIPIWIIPKSSYLSLLLSAEPICILFCYLMPMELAICLIKLSPSFLSR